MLRCQDYLGAKVFSLLLENKGFFVNKMSGIIAISEKEGLIDLEEWIQFREIRNELEHDYLDDLEEVLLDLKFCVDNFKKIEDIVFKVIEYAKN